MTDYRITEPSDLYHFELIIPVRKGDDAARGWLAWLNPADLTGSLEEARALAEELDVDIRLSTPQGFAAGRVWRVEEVEDDDDDDAAS